MKQVTQFQSDAGNTFANEHDAHKDDLRHVLAQLADNAAIADKIVQALTPDTRKKLLVALDHLSQRDDEPELPMPQYVGRDHRINAAAHLIAAGVARIPSAQRPRDRMPQISDAIRFDTEPRR